MQQAARRLDVRPERSGRDGAVPAVAHDHDVRVIEDLLRSAEKHVARLHPALRDTRSRCQRSDEVCRNKVVTFGCTGEGKNLPDYILMPNSTFAFKFQKSLD
jgi:hypothetical protein